MRPSSPPAHGGRGVGLGLALGALFALMSPPASAAESWYSLSGRAELGNTPHFGFDPNPLGALSLSQTQLTGRLPWLELRVGSMLAPTVEVQLSGSLNQDITVPLANAELYDAYQSRIAWRKAGGIGLNPLYVAQIEDAFVTWKDPDRNGYLRVGQFLVPFGHDDYLMVAPPVAISPIETPMTDYLSTLGPGVYQNSTLTRWRDIGAELAGNGGAFPWVVGVFNGSGPNRLDDNGDKDLLMRVDWRTSDSDSLGVSAQWGNDQLYPTGYQNVGVPTARRRLGLHWRFKWGDATFKGEWSRNQRRFLDPGPVAEGYVLEGDQSFGGGTFYASYSQFNDPYARPGAGYLVRETAIGQIFPLLNGLAARLEADYRWEFSGTQHDDYGRYLTSIEMALGGPSAPPKPSAPGGGTFAPP